jgi:hypothetical protein
MRQHPTIARKCDRQSFGDQTEGGAGFEKETRPCRRFDVELDASFEFAIR